MDVKKYVQFHLDKMLISPEKIHRKKSVALIGIGPHAKRIYLNYFKKHKVNLGLVIDLDSKKEEVRQYLNENGFKNTKIFTISDSLKNKEHLSNKVASNLLAVCNTLEITHIIISTEPKAHNMYIEFALKNNIDVMTDKPITVTTNMTSTKSINKVRNQYYNILKLSENSNAMCKVMCQRQYHKGYEYIKTLLNEVVSKYQIPITYIDIYHCDGNWEMPHDLLKENHPYKYGYGKLFHSGYHFIDLLSDFIKINNQLSGTKKITKGEVYSNCFTPNDEIGVFNVEDYKRIFEKQSIPLYYTDNTNPKFNNYGEKNFYGLMKFTNNYNQTITNVNLNLLHYGISRRGWINTRNFYKENGRIRHERINIQVGTLLNIQVHSYQSKEIKERTDDLTEEQVGGLEHFDIDIYRNVDIIGGKPFERIKLGDLYSEKEKKNILGYNELSREEYLTNFLNGKCERGDIKDQALAIEILHSCARGIHNYYHNIETPQSINVRNYYTYPIKLEDFKKKATKINRDKDKHLIKTYSTFDNKYEYSVMMNYLLKEQSYEIYLCIIEGEKKAVGGLLYKETNDKIWANLYFYILKIIANLKQIYIVFQLCNRKNNKST